MTTLTISLLGHFRVLLHGEEVTRFGTDKVRALLAYLAVEIGRPHRRELLAGLLWPDQPESSARHNLSQSLLRLRRAIGDEDVDPPFLLVNRQTIRLNPQGDLWVDVGAFLEAGGLSKRYPPSEIPEAAVTQIHEAVARYNEGFLAHSLLSAGPEFEEWALNQRTTLHLRMMKLLAYLVSYHQSRGEQEEMVHYARLRTELDPLQEEAHRQLMRMLALSGQRSAALEQYDLLSQLLQEELGVEPGGRVRALYEQIRSGHLHPRPQEQKRELPRFVDRERELRALRAPLQKVLLGRGRVLFVSGEAGSGKTALITEFARRAEIFDGQVLVARGHCNAHTGIGDPYLPFREILQLLTGDIEARQAGGTLTREQAHRLQGAFRDTLRILLDQGSRLIPLFIGATALAHRLERWAPEDRALAHRLQSVVQQRARSQTSQLEVPTALRETPQQIDLFEQMTSVFQTLAKRHPLLLILEDLQWADRGTISLLFHLGRRLPGQRILIVGAYRTSDVFPHRENARHPLTSVINEFRRDFGEAEIKLDEADGRKFIDAYLDSEPNRLDEAFRTTLYRHTGGNPLFTVELLRGLQERGDLLQDDADRWRAREELDWEKLPARVEAVIAERIHRLSPEIQALLESASVEGDLFTAEVIARVWDIPAPEIVRELSGSLSKQHRLVTAHSLEQLPGNGQRLSRYRFHHVLFQKYLYQQLDDVERAYLHHAVGEALEHLHGKSAEGRRKIAPQLAWHFERAGDIDKAVTYLLEAGEQALLLSAHEEAGGHFRRGLALLKEASPSPGREHLTLDLELGLGAAIMSQQGWGAAERAKVYARAYQLCRKIGELEHLLPVLYVLGQLHRALGHYRKATALGDQLFDLARQVDHTYLAAAYSSRGGSRFCLGEVTEGRIDLERASAAYVPRHHRSLILLAGQDMLVGSLGWLGLALWELGYPNQALDRGVEALARAEELQHSSSLAFALFSAGTSLHLLCGEIRAAEAAAVQLLHVANEYGCWCYHGWARFVQGYVRLTRGEIEEGLEQMRRGMEEWKRTGTANGRIEQLLYLAEGYRRAGEIKKGLLALDEALALVEVGGGHHREPEIHRLWGELLLEQGQAAEAERLFVRAVEIARRQQTRAWELRATLALCRLWQSQGCEAQARERLSALYGWFTEGYETADLRAAGGLLEALDAAES
ncbi:MAG: ATP-binding protein [Anaerolineales bacterium]